VAKVDGTIQECGDYFRLRLKKGATLKEKNLYLSFSITLSPPPRRAQMIVDNPRKRVFFEKIENIRKPFARFLRIKEEMVTVISISREDHEKIQSCLAYDPKKIAA
jgi:hypothetical protein